MVLTTLSMTREPKRGTLACAEKLTVDCGLIYHTNAKKQKKNKKELETKTDIVHKIRQLSDIRPRVVVSPINAFEATVMDHAYNM